jgi:hypothetical protein
MPPNGKPTQTFESLIESERERLTQNQKEVLAKREVLDKELEAIGRELKAITAYQDIKEGKEPAPPPAAAEPKEPRKPRAPRAETAERRQKILGIIEAFPNAATAALINQELGATEDADKRAIASSLFALTKEKVIHQAHRKGPYTLVEQPKEEPPSPP